ncbi:MAG: acyl carrier protein [Acidobacteriota bacterium]|nr:acyl carrier protein [Acidobacteriota bacterium]
MARTEQEVADALRTHLQAEFLYDRPDVRLDDDFGLVEEGLIDSIGIFRLVTFVETTFDFALDPQDMNMANFGSIRAIARLVTSRSNKQP